MCTNCVSAAEATVAQAAVAGYLLRGPARRLMVALGLAHERDLVRRDVHTVAFLRSLDLDPHAVLGADVVAAADAWVPQRRPVPALAALRDASARPIGSQALPAAQ